MVRNGRAPVRRRAVLTTVRTSASHWAAHMAQVPVVILRWMTARSSARSQVLLVGSEDVVEAALHASQGAA